MIDLGIKLMQKELVLTNNSKFRISNSVRRCTVLQLAATAAPCQGRVEVLMRGSHAIWRGRKSTLSLMNFDCSLRSPSCSTALQPAATARQQAMPQVSNRLQPCKGEKQMNPAAEPCVNCNKSQTSICFSTVMQQAAATQQQGMGSANV
jgi:hypothetical protein